MLLAGMGTIYHSPLCEEETEKIILNELLLRGFIKADDALPTPHITPPPRKINLEKFAGVLEKHMESYSALREE